MRDLHTLAAYIERSSRGDTQAAAELQHRLATLRQGDVETLWRAA
jgi:hypothetical protein